MVYKAKKSLTLLSALFLLGGCKSNEVTNYITNYIYKDVVDLDFYDETEFDPISEQKIYNKDLFYRNDKQLPYADPGILYISDPKSEYYGKFFAYGTRGNKIQNCAISDDLMNWHNNGPYVFDTNTNSDIVRFLDSNCWAQECVFDEKTGKYYLFMSCTPKDVNSSFWLPIVLTSNSPAGPFSLVAHNDFLMPNGTEINDPSLWYYKYCLFDPYRTTALMDELGISEDDKGCDLLRAIDLDPFVDPQTGEKYLYLKNNKLQNVPGIRIFVVHMTDWLTPDYDEVAPVTFSKKKEVDSGTPGDATWEISNNNEGPWVEYHKGKYYLSYSCNPYKSRAYLVAQAVSDSPMGPFRKLEDFENNILISCDAQTRDDISGPGHHSIVRVDAETGEEKAYIVYHKHDDTEAGGDPRHVAVDELKWVTVEDKYGEELDVLYCNGPTYSVQPRLDAFAEYKNIADKAAITATNIANEGDEKYLNDGLIRVNRFDSAQFNDKYIKQVGFNGDTTITLSFENYEAIRSVVVYNSNEMSSIITEIKQIEFDCIDANNAPYKAVVNDVKYDLDSYRSTDDVDTIRPGTAVIAEFDEIKTNKIVLHIDEASTDEVFVHGEGEYPIEISEIKVLGKRG
jgi:hypothetical protein